MLTKALFALSSISFLLACTPGHENEALLYVPVKSTTPIVGEELQYYRDQLQPYNGTGNIRLAVSQMWKEKYPDAQTSIFSVKKYEEADHTLYGITLIFDNVPDDDSNSGFRYDIEIKQNRGIFELVKLEESWRCWPDRGHRHFGAEPCK